jgi:hypothetical protein
MPEKSLDALYRRPLTAKRTGALFEAFPYPTKISSEAIALYIAAHTKPGDTVFDGFGGSGTTGVAPLLCERPTDELRAEAIRLGLNVQWGARNAVLSTAGGAGGGAGACARAAGPIAMAPMAAQGRRSLTSLAFIWILLDGV